MIDAGLSEAAALIVFKTAYLSYECFIQETKYELAGREPPQERRGNGRLMHANNGLREGGRGKEGKEKTGGGHIINSLASVSPSASPSSACFHPLRQSLSILVTGDKKKKTAISFQKTEKPHEHFLTKAAQRQIHLVDSGDVGNSILLQ